MDRIQLRGSLILLACLALDLGWQSADAQQISLAFSSVDSPNANWYIAKERQLYKKYGLDADLVFIPSSTTTISAVVAGSVSVGNISGGATANAAVGRRRRGSGRLLHQYLALRLDRARVDSIGAATQGQERSASAASAVRPMWRRGRFLKELKLEPDKDVAILQVGGSTERAAAFRTGRIVAFPAPPGTIHLAQGHAAPGV